MFENLNITGFEYEHLCFEFLDELRGRWSPLRRLAHNTGSADRLRSRELAGKRFELLKPGYGRRPLELLADGYIGEGGGYRHAMWWIEGGQLRVLDGGGGETCRLTSLPRNWWCGSNLQTPNRIVRLLPQLGS